jgi:hypothetical protein
MEVKENNTLQKLTELLKYVGSLIATAASLFGAVKDISGLRILGVVLALLGLGGLSFLVYQAVKRAKQKRRSIRFREEDRPTGFTAVKTILLILRTGSTGTTSALGSCTVKAAWAKHPLFKPGSSRNWKSANSNGFTYR